MILLVVEFQPLWKICTSNLGVRIFPKFRRENSKNIWVDTSSMIMYPFSSHACLASPHLIPCCCVFYHWKNSEFSVLIQAIPSALHSSSAHPWPTWVEAKGWFEVVPLECLKSWNLSRQNWDSSTLLMEVVCVWVSVVVQTFFFADFLASPQHLQFECWVSFAILEERGDLQ